MDGAWRASVSGRGMQDVSLEGEEEDGQGGEFLLQRLEAQYVLFPVRSTHELTSDPRTQELPPQQPHLPQIETRIAARPRVL